MAHDPHTEAPHAGQACCSLLAWPFGQAASIRRIKGSRAFRRRLMELGLVPGTRIRVAKVAPLGDPLELEVRGSRLSLRRHEIAALEVSSPERPRRLRVLS